MGKVIAIMNFKGGCAKTTTTVNLAAALHKLGKSVLVIDTDFQCNASNTLGYRPSHGGSLYDILISKGAIEVPIYEYKKGFDLLPSSLEMKSFNDFMASKNRREYVLRRLTEVLKGGYDYIFIDCPPSGGLLNTNAMCAASEVIIPIDCEPYGIQGAVTILDEIEEVRNDEVNPDLKVRGFLLTRYNSSLSLHKEAVRMMHNLYPGMVFQTKIRRNTALSKASSAKKSIYDFDDKCAGAEDYMRLAKELLSCEK